MKTLTTMFFILSLLIAKNSWSAVDSKKFNACMEEQTEMIVENADDKTTEELKVEHETAVKYCNGDLNAWSTVNGSGR